MSLFSGVPCDKWAQTETQEAPSEHQTRFYSESNGALAQAA